MSTAQKRPLAAFVLLAVAVTVFVAQALDTPNRPSSDDVASSSVILINGGQARDDAAPNRPAGQNGFFDGLISGLNDSAPGSAADPSALGPSGDHPRARRAAGAGANADGPAVRKKQRLRGPKGAQSSNSTEAAQQSETQAAKKAEREAKKAAQRAEKAEEAAEKAESKAEKDRRKWVRKNRKSNDSRHSSSSHSSHSHSSSSHGSHSHSSQGHGKDRGHSRDKNRGHSKDKNRGGHSRDKDRGHSKDKNRGHSKHKNRGHNKGKHRGRR